MDGKFRLFKFGLNRDPNQGRFFKVKVPFLRSNNHYNLNFKKMLVSLCDADAYA